MRRVNDAVDAEDDVQADWPVGLTTEGAHFVLVLGFVLLGAVIRGINLMLLLSSVLIGLLLISYGFGRRSLRLLRLQRIAPERVAAGEVFTVEIKAESRRSFLASHAVDVHDRIAGPSLKTGETLRPGVTFVLLPPKKQLSGTYQAVLAVRGRHRLGPLRASTRHPLSILVIRRRVPAPAEVLVSPALGEVDLAALGAGWREATGRSPLRPSRTADAEFHSLRPWQSSDSTRRIHARASARRSEPVVRHFADQQRQEMELLVDLAAPPAEAASPAAAAAHHDAVERALSLAATLWKQLQSEPGRGVRLRIAGDSFEEAAGPAGGAMCEAGWRMLAVAAPHGDSGPIRAQLQTAVQRPAVGRTVLVVSTRQAPAEVCSSGLPPRVEWLWIDGPAALSAFKLPECLRPVASPV